MSLGAVTSWRTHYLGCLSMRVKGKK
ncbi:hypothetical protein NXF25_018822 [Crotalus adamanteus]|uniref:Uncharacterized protein n=1 Tax=Crotalus adamanteus TaxID=8729 RepID=A0AAW1B0C3_CROAD